MVNMFNFVEAGTSCESLVNINIYRFPFIKLTRGRNGKSGSYLWPSGCGLYTSYVNNLQNFVNTEADFSST